jgi:predicted dehydrogenase
MESSMKFLIIGFGSIGRRHFRNLLSLGERDISFFRTGKSTLIEEELHGFPIFADLEKALSQQPDGVIVANPTAFHLDVAIPAAKQGCHILLEKPISNNRDRVDEFVKLVEKHESNVLVGYQFRYHPNLIRIKELLANNTVGKPVAIRSHWGEYLPDWHPWEDYRKGYSARRDLGGGVLLTLCHNFDYLRWLFGEGMVRSSMLGYDGGLDIDVEDTAEILLEFDNNLIASVHLNFLQSPGKHTLEIICREGNIFWDYYSSKVEVVIRGHGRVEKESYFCPENFDRNNLFLDEMRHFIEVIKGIRSPICTLDDGIRALDLIVEAGKQGYS